MKKLLLCVAAIVAAHGLHAQECEAVAPPYSLDFEAITAPELPACTAAISTSGNNWTTATTPGSGFASKALQYTALADEAANAWFFTGALNLAAGGYKITYTYGNNSTTAVEKFNISYGNEATAAGMTNSVASYTNVTGATPATVTTGPIYITTPGTYYFGFNATSDAGQGSLYIDNISIQPWVCETPATLSVSNITTTAATLAWDAVTEGETVQFYQISVVAAGADPVPGPTTSELTLGSYAPLTPGTSYTAYVRTFCMGTWGDWIGQDFTTPLCNEPTAIPYTQDFETPAVPAIPECTLAVSGETGGNWVTANAPGNGFTTKTLSYTATDAAADAWFFTPGLPLEGGQRYKITYTYGNNSATTVEKFKVAYGTGFNADAMTNTIATYDNVTGGESATASNGPIYIAESGTYSFGFNVFSDAGQGSLFIDNVIIEPWVCESPATLTVTNITTTAATLSWGAVTEGEDIQFYQICIVPAGTEPTAGPNTSELTLGSYAPLTPATSYTAYVRSFCSGAWGDWVGQDFTTPFCDEVATVTYTQDFETATVPAIPDCTLAVAGETGGNWVTAAAPGNGFTSNALAYTATDAAADARFFTQGIALEAGQGYKITYTYGNNSTTTTEKFSVAYGTDATGAGMVNNLATYNNVTGGVATSAANGPVYITESATYYFGFHVTSDANQGSLYIDNITVEPWVCANTSGIIVTDITTTSATISWNGVTEGETVQFYQVSIVPAGENPVEGPTTSELTYTSSPAFTLTPNTAYTVYVRTFCSGTWGDWVPQDFTTQQVNGLSDAAFEGLSVYPNPTNNTITLNNGQQIDSAALYNMTGQQVLKAAINSTSGQLQLHPLAAGVYMLKIQAGNAAKTIKVIKQ